MITLPIFESEKQYAIDCTVKFDKQKVHNKFYCSTNWIGFLGELIFDKYLTKKQVYHIWNKFIKEDYKQPDFEINNKTIDIKTTFNQDLWFQNINNDYYILANVSKNVDKISYVGYISGFELLELYIKGKCKEVIRDNRKDYVLSGEYLKPVHNLVNNLKYIQDKYSN